jgi:nicotinamidase-related amidase
MPSALGRPAVVLIDVINTFDFEGSEGLVSAASQAAPAIEELTKRARAQGVPVIYANDNFGQWRSDFSTLVETCLEVAGPGQEIAARLTPQESDYFVLKPKHSSFFATPLEIVLRQLGIDTLVFAGFATDLCVLFSAHDAHMRGFNLFVPEDCTAANTPEITRRTLIHLREALKCATGSSVTLDFGMSSE